MPYIFILYFFVFSIGFFVYLRKPQMLFIYWLSVPPFIVPLFFILFNPSYIGEQTFDTFYWGYLTPLSYLLIVVTFLEYLKDRDKVSNIKKIIKPLIIVSVFFVVQNLLTGFSFGPLISNIREILFLLLPTLALSISSTIRPDRKLLIRFIFYFIIIQTLFCFFNTLGLSVYSKFIEDATFADDYFSGTFLRYNHLTNYLTTMYLILTIEYFVNNAIPKYVFILFTLLLGIIILMSGARISVVLFFMIIGMSLLFYRGRNLILISVLAAVFLWGVSFFASKYDVGIQNADSSSGLERNVTGLVDLAGSQDTDDNTLALSAILLVTNFNNPLMGNGYAFRNTTEYDISDNMNEEVVKTDARMAYMLVEYGIIGFLCLVYLFCRIFKANMVQFNVENRRMWILIILYYIAFTFTETGIFDLMQFSMISILCFSRETMDIDNQEEQNEIPEVVSEDNDGIIGEEFEKV